MKKKSIILIISAILIILLGLGLYFFQGKTYKIEFTGAEVMDPIEVKEGTYFIKPSDPVREGYKFIGWYYNNQLFDFNQKITKDIKLEARWIEEMPSDEPSINIPIITHEVRFDSMGGNEVPTQNVENGKIVMEPTNPTKKGYKFIGWYKGNELYNFDSLVNEDIILVAKWEKEEEDKVTYKVTFNTDGGSSISNKTVEENKTVSKPTNPTKKGYVFVKWQLDGKDYDFSNKVTSNITLKAIWKKIVTYEVTFNTDGGSSISNKTVEENKPVSKPTNPTKKGYVFVKWQLDGKDYDFSSKVTSNITLKAVYRETNRYTITFNTDGGSSISNKTVEENKTVSKPTNPTKEGYVFVKWQLDGKDYNFSNKVTKNITLKAVWKQKNYTYSVAYADPMVPADVKITVYEEGKEISIVGIYRPSDGKKICGPKAITNKSNIESLSKLTIELTSGVKVTANKK